MNAEQLLAHYDRVADAPDAIARLRRFVLDLAVRGKLVAQNPVDEPASDLSKWITRGDIDEPSLPRNWCRPPVGEILDFQYGKGLKARERTEHGPVPVYGSNGVVGYTTEPLTQRPSIIVGRKGSAGALNKCNGPSWTTDVAYFVEAPEFLDLHFLYFSLAVLDLGKLGKGIKPGLSRSDAYTKFICIPPLTEQHRIVARVDELVAVCDRREEARTVREDTRDRLTKASYARLSTPDTDDVSFRSHARVAINTLPALTARADQVKHLRQTILNLTVRGKLVEQDPRDEPAIELLKRIEKEKTQLVRAEKVKRPRRSQPFDPADVPVEVPMQWAWATLRQISLRLHYGFTTSASKLRNEVRLLRITDIQNDRVDWSTVPYCEINADKFQNYALECGDLLIARTGGTIGKTFLVTEVPVKSVFASYLIRVQPARSLFAEYLKLFCGSDLYWDQLRAGSRGGGQPNVNGQSLGNMIVPLPPLAEQRRIVAKVDELMALCDRLENSLGTSDTTRLRLLESLLHETLAPAIGREMEAAE